MEAGSGWDVEKTVCAYLLALTILCCCAENGILQKEVRMQVNLKAMVLLFGLAVIVSVGVLAYALQEVNPSCEKFLPAAAIEKISGRQNVKLVPYNPAMGAGGTCNYAILKIFFSLNAHFFTRHLKILEGA